MTKTLLILGAGGHGRVVADCALASGLWTEVFFLDDRYPDLVSVNDWKIIGKVSDCPDFLSSYPEMALGVGVSYDSLRLEWIQLMSQAGATFPPVIHPSAVVSQYASVGDGSVVFAGAVLNVNASVGKGCIINTNAMIDHDCSIGDGSHISPAACLAGNVVVGDLCWVGMGANILQGVDIGRQSIIGAGAVVLKSIPAGSKAYGVPAKLVNNS